MTPLSTAAVPLAEAITDRQATVAVVGLGSVGLQLLVAAGREGFRLIGVDTDAGRFGTDPCLLVAADVIVVAVPTLWRESPPDPSLLRASMEDVARALRPGQLVILESTTFSGMTEASVRSILERTGLVAGRDFALAWCPERTDPADGRPRPEAPKVVDGATPACAGLAALFYGVLGDDVLRIPSPRADCPADDVVLT